MSAVPERRCPECEHAVVPVMFGMPGPEMVEEEQRGEIVLGGCVVDGDDPVWACSACGQRWLGTPDGEVLPVPAGHPLPDVVLELERRLYDEIFRERAADEYTAWEAEARHERNAALLAAALEALTGRSADAIAERVHRHVMRDMGPPPSWAPGR